MIGNKPRYPVVIKQGSSPHEYPRRAFGTKTYFYSHSCLRACPVIIQKTLSGCLGTLGTGSKTSSHVPGMYHNIKWMSMELKKKRDGRKKGEGSWCALALSETKLTSFPMRCHCLTCCKVATKSEAKQGLERQMKRSLKKWEVSCISKKLETSALRCPGQETCCTWQLLCVSKWLCYSIQAWDEGCRSGFRHRWKRQ